MNEPNQEGPQPDSGAVNIMMPGAPASGEDQWLDACLVLRSELKFDVRTEGDKTFVVIEDPVRSKYFQVGPREYKFISCVDGKRTTRQIVNTINQSRREDDIPFDEESARTICQWLVQSNLASGQGIDNSKRLHQQAESMKRAKLIGLLNPICARFTLFNPNNMLIKIQPYMTWMFSKWFAVIWLIVGIWASTVIYQNWDQMGAASTGILSGYSWIWLLLTWIFLKVIHEAAHGVACRRYGGEVPEAGVLLLLFTPMAFVNVTSMWRFDSRWHRMVVAAAGMYVEIFISFIAVIVWSESIGTTADVAFNIFLMASVTTILFNANPLMRFDGYFLLSDAIGVPNLYTKGTKWFGDRVRSLFFGVPTTPNPFPADEYRRVTIYGSMAFFWKISISVSLIIGAGVLFQGAGLALSAFGVAMWFGLPIYKQFKSAFGPMAKHPVRIWRVATSCLVLIAIGLGFFFVLKAPATKSAPAIVQFSDETVLRAGADGFYQSLKVTDGEQVTEGQVLVVLENPTLSNEVLELERLAEEAKIQSRIYKKQDELSLAMTELKKLEELQQQLSEKQEEAAGLIVRAPFDGFVFQRNIENEIGNFAHRGDPILSIAQRETKEVVVSIDQRDLESIKGNEGELLRVAFPGVKLFDSKLIRVNPRASQEPTHPTLCAHAGGPLTVRPAGMDSESDESKYELLTPRFNVVLELDSDSSRQLQSGQRGRAFFSTQRQSLGSYLYIATSDWLKNQIEIATQTAVF